MVHLYVRTEDLTPAAIPTTVEGYHVFNFLLAPQGFQTWASEYRSLNARPSQPDQIAPDSGSTLGSDGFEDDKICPVPLGRQPLLVRHHLNYFASAQIMEEYPLPSVPF
jgi:hypothetical protein